MDTVIVNGQTFYSQEKVSKMVMEIVGKAFALPSKEVANTAPLVPAIPAKRRGRRPGSRNRVHTPPAPVETAPANGAAAI